jgi:hypothetical protein
MKTTTNEIQNFLWSQAAMAARLWFLLQSADNYAGLYLWFKRGEVTVAAEKPDGFELATGERLSPAATEEQMKFRIVLILNKLPILPESLCS